ncbi:MAG: GlxA family transcriptional regulator, partial [Methylobacteriaceae bacterium]|nr:GlxA family transcriptional regulator [Methylobacteriaceae bacterium]
MTAMTRRSGEEPAVLGFALVPNFSMIAFASALEPLRLANRVSREEIFRWRLYSPDGRPVNASNGVAVTVDGAYSDMADLRDVVVCGGIDVQKINHGALIARLRKLASQGVSIGAVCTGPFILAQSGLLDGYRCTIHWENYDSFREQFPHLEVTQELYEIDRNRFTCAGGTAAIDMMLKVISTTTQDHEVAALVTDELIHHRMRDSNERQRMELRSRLGVAHPKLLAVVAEMEKRLERPATCAQLAKRAGLSPRQLERLFQKYIGSTPTRYYLGVRLDRARHLLLQTSIPILSVGIACGFVSASHFSKCYSEHFRRMPSDERRGSSRGARTGPAGKVPAGAT